MFHGEAEGGKGEEGLRGKEEGAKEAGGGLEGAGRREEKGGWAGRQRSTKRHGLTQGPQRLQVDVAQREVERGHVACLPCLSLPQVASSTTDATRGRERMGWEEGQGREGKPARIW